MILNILYVSVHKLGKRHKSVDPPLITPPLVPSE